MIEENFTEEELSVEEYVLQVRRECALALAKQEERIAELTAENIKLKETIAVLKMQSEANNVSEEEDFELDMQKILRPDGKLELAELCRDLGLMEDE